MLYRFPAYLVPWARQSQGRRSAYRAIKFQSIIKKWLISNKSVNWETHVLRSFCLHYLDSSSLLRCGWNAALNNSWMAEALELLRNSNSLQRPLPSKTHWTFGRGTLRGSQKRSNTKQRFIDLDRFAASLFVDMLPLELHEESETRDKGNSLWDKGNLSRVSNIRKRNNEW